MEEKIIIIDFGSQYTQLIGRKIRELNVYSEIVPFNGEVVLTKDVKGVIFSGSPYSVLDASSPRIELQKYFDKIPVLGICYGAQLIAHETGGNVMPSKIREYGRANLAKVEKNSLMSDISLGSQVWMSHADTIAEVDSQFEIMASTSTVEVAAYQNQERKIYGLQFHPEVYHSSDGNLVLKKFLVDICGCSQSWTPLSFVEEKVAELKELLGNDKVVLGLSGGVDSTVAAVLLQQAIGDNLHCIFVDNGLLRKNEFDQVLKQYEALQLNVKGVRAGDIFLDKLRGVSDPEEKRKHIGNTFIEVFDEEAHRIQDVNWLGQGTIYPDVIESVTGTGGPSVTIKSHHNVGGLPDFMKLKVVEPLRLLFKDEVRRVGKALDIPAEILGRHPFPGPGLAIRILGDITAEKVRLLQEVDDIYISTLKDEGLYDEVWQAGAILLPIQSVGVMGDERTYEQVVALRAVSSTDGMTADWSHLPHEVLSKISNDIINKVKGVNRVVYDISSKPPSTIEWE